MIKFNSPKIEAIIDDIKNNSIFKYLDALSTDLIAIEASLDRICPIPFEWRTNNDLNLMWKKTSNNKFRICVQWKDDISLELLTRALCETPIEIRIMAYPHLEDFLLAFNENNQKYYSMIMKDYKELK